MRDQKIPEPNVNRTVRLHHTIGRINAAMIRAGSRTSLFESISSIAAESGLFSAMSVSLRSPDTERSKHELCFCGSGTPACFSNDFARQIAAGADEQSECAVSVFNNLAADRSSHPWLDEALAAGHAAMAALPIPGRDRPMGRLLVFSVERDAFDREFLATLQQLAEDIAFLVGRFDETAPPRQSEAADSGMRNELQCLLDHLRTTREDERQLISRELHDQLGQTLSALKMDIIGLEKRIAPSDAKCAAHLTHMRALVADALDETHRIVAAKVPRVLEERGLKSALEWLGTEFGERTGVACRMTVDLPSSPYAEIVSTTAFRCVQECLTNITRHAAASKVVVTVRQVANALKLCIVDDGRGLSSDFAERGRFGLLGLRQRAQALGGQMEIESGPQHGTSIKIRLPALPMANVSTVRPLSRRPATIASPAMELPT